MLRQYLKSILLIFALIAILSSQAGIAADSAKSNGYLTLFPAQAKSTSDKVEIIEFFSYTCPVCFSYDAPLAAWIAKNRERIVFKRIPMSIRPEWEPAQKMYFALELLGKADVMHNKIFKAIHQERSSIKNDEAIFNLVEKLGLNRKQFTAMYLSSAVQEKVQQAMQMQTSYQIDQVPLVAIDGRYLTSPAKAAEMIGDDKSETELQQMSFTILNGLISKIRKD
jgi:thiol:disulfide interchange protein DsbA